MTWPTVTIVTTAMDAGADDASLARAEIKQMADNVNAVKDARGAADGIAELDSGGLVPIAEVPTITAVKGGTGQTAYTTGDLLYASSATALSKLAAGSAGFVLKSNGAGVAPSYQTEGGGFDSGTRLLFQQTAAPTGWTKEISAAYNNVALRIVTGSVGNGGTHAFTSVFSASKSTDAFTLTTAHMPAHTHGGAVIAGSSFVFSGSIPNTLALGASGSAGGGGSHSHVISNFDLKYRDVIIASKD